MNSIPTYRDDKYFGFRVGVLVEQAILMSDI